MARPKRSSRGPGEKERAEVLLEDMNSKFNLILDGLKTLTQRAEGVEHRISVLEHRMSRLEQQVERLEIQAKRVELALVETRQELQRLSDRITDHEKTHAT